LLVYLEVSTNIVLPLDIAPELIILTVRRGTTLCVNKRPATLILIPESCEGINWLLLLIADLLVLLFLIAFHINFLTILLNLILLRKIPNKLTKILLLKYG